MCLIKKKSKGTNGESVSPGTVSSGVASWRWGRPPTPSHPVLSSQRSHQLPNTQMTTLNTLHIQYSTVQNITRGVRILQIHNSIFHFKATIRFNFRFQILRWGRWEWREKKTRENHQSRFWCPIEHQLKSHQPTISDRLEQLAFA